jgi:hypothetical protein
MIRTLRSWLSSAKLIWIAGLSFVFWLKSPAAYAQCQTWSMTPEFGFDHVGGNWINAFQVFDDGTGSVLWVGGDFGAASPPSQTSFNIARWNGHSWVTTPTLNDEVDALTVFDEGTGDALYAGGSFSIAGDFGLARWNGGGWSLVGGGLTPFIPSGTAAVYALAAYDAGSGPELYVGGAFKGAGAVNTEGIIRWDGANWHMLGTGLGPLSHPHSYVYHMTVFDDGHGPALYVAGDFGTAGGQPISQLAKWDGTNWSALGSGFNGQVSSMAVWDDGSGSKLYVSGVLGPPYVPLIGIWDGATWSYLPVAPLSGASAMVPFDDGRGPALFVSCNVMAGGVQTHFIARWDGTSWSALGGGLPTGPVHCMATYDDGSGHGPDLYCGGQFFTAGGGIRSIRIARWIRCAGSIDSFCPGDQTLAPCPCSNLGQFGHGCNNSANTGGALLAPTGSTSPDTLHLTSSGELPHSLSILLQGDAPVLTVVGFGDGLRCTGGHLFRLFTTNAVNGTAAVPGQGDPTISARSSAMGDPLMPGSIRLYQVYYRDPWSTCSNYFNASNGVRVVW